jgi:hypothetical protein
MDTAPVCMAIDPSQHDIALHAVGEKRQFDIAANGLLQISLDHYAAESRCSRRGDRWPAGLDPFEIDAVAVRLRET